MVADVAAVKDAVAGCVDAETAVGTELLIGVIVICCATPKLRIRRWIE